MLQLVRILLVVCLGLALQATAEQSSVDVAMVELDVTYQFDTPNDPETDRLYEINRDNPIVQLATSPADGHLVVLRKTTHNQAHQPAEGQVAAASCQATPDTLDCMNTEPFTTKPPWFETGVPGKVVTVVNGSDQLDPGFYMANKNWNLSLGRDEQRLYFSNDGASWSHRSADELVPSLDVSTLVVKDNELYIIGGVVEDTTMPWPTGPMRVAKSINGRDWVSLNDNVTACGAFHGRQFTNQGVAVVAKDGVGFFLTGATVNYSAGEQWYYQNTDLLENIQCFSQDGITWQRNGQGPYSTRVNHLSAFFGDDLYIIGGHTEMPRDGRCYPAATDAWRVPYDSWDDVNSWQQMVSFAWNTPIRKGAEHSMWTVADLGSMGAGGFALVWHYEELSEQSNVCQGTTVGEHWLAITTTTTSTTTTITTSTATSFTSTETSSTMTQTTTSTVTSFTMTQTSGTQTSVTQTRSTGTETSVTKTQKRMTQTSMTQTSVTSTIPTKVIDNDWQSLFDNVSKGKVIDSKGKGTASDGHRSILSMVPAVIMLLLQLVSS